MAQAQDLQEVDALREAAIVRYARCFKDGTRTTFNVPCDWIESLPEHLYRIHKSCLDLRDKRAAHSVSDREINVPVINLKYDRRSSTYEVDQMQVRRYRVVCLPKECMAHLRKLSMALAEMVEADHNAERARLLAVAKSLPVEALVARIASQQSYRDDGRLTRRAVDDD